MTIEAPVWLVGNAQVRCIIRRIRGIPARSLEGRGNQIVSTLLERVFFLFGL